MERESQEGSIHGASIHRGAPRARMAVPLQPPWLEMRRNGLWVWRCLSSELPPGTGRTLAAGRSCTSAGQLLKSSRCFCFRAIKGRGLLKGQVRDSSNLVPPPACPQRQGRTARR